MYALLIAKGAAPCAFWSYKEIRKVVSTRSKLFLKANDYNAEIVRSGWINVSSSSYADFSRLSGWTNGFAALKNWRTF